MAESCSYSQSRTIHDTDDIAARTDLWDKRNGSRLIPYASPDRIASGSLASGWGEGSAGGRPILEHPFSYSSLLTLAPYCSRACVNPRTPDLQCRLGQPFIRVKIAMHGLCDVYSNLRSAEPNLTPPNRVARYKG